MAENAQEALDKMLEDLRREGGKSVADDITEVVARGITEEMVARGKVKELTQRPLNSEEAYGVAVEMLIAALEPMIMKKHALLELQKLADSKPALVWKQDFVERSPVAPSDYEDVSIPDTGNLKRLEEELRKIINLMGDVNGKL